MENRQKAISELFNEYFDEEKLSFLPQDDKVRQDFVEVIKYFFSM